MSQPANPTLAIARQYVAAGLSVIPIRPDGSKAPPCRWVEYQSRLASSVELEAWFRETPFGLAIVCGKVSGNLVIIDFEDSESFESWREVVRSKHPKALDALPISETPSGGRHVYYRSPVKPDGNRKLAMCENGQTLIEVRAEGGYVLAPGCPAGCHSSGKLYRWLQRGWLNAR